MPVEVVSGALQCAAPCTVHSAVSVAELQV